VDLVCVGLRVLVLLVIRSSMGIIKVNRNYLPLDFVLELVGPLVLLTPFRVEAVLRVILARSRFGE